MMTHGSRDRVSDILRPVSALRILMVLAFVSAAHAASPRLDELRAASIARQRELRATLRFKELHGINSRATLRVRAMLAIGTWPPRDDAAIVAQFVDFVRSRHASGPDEVWYRFVPTHPDRFLDQGSHRVGSRPIPVDVEIP
jgi:hypothetical protein